MLQDLRTQDERRAELCAESGDFRWYRCKEPPSLATTRAWCELNPAASLPACAERRTPGNEVIRLDEGAAGPTGSSEVVAGCSVSPRLGAPWAALLASTAPLLIAPLRRLRRRR